ncbi:MAG: guanylate kinase [Planctomycetota bacterium]|nr:MAG: guanylate kinase [Planctomycetota bacterium]
MAGGSTDIPDVPVVIISGPSGSGKSTIVNRLIRVCPVRLYKCVSATTRPPRPGEVDGEDYYFLTPEEFERRRQAGAFLECEQVHNLGHWYGTLIDELRKARQQKAIPVLEIDVQGAVKVRRRVPRVLSFFVRTPSDREYADRLRQRNTDAPEVIEKRLKTALEELKLADRYDYQIVNDDLDRAVSEIAERIAQWEGRGIA